MSLTDPQRRALLRLTANDTYGGPTDLRPKGGPDAPGKRRTLEALEARGLAEFPGWTSVKATPEGAALAAAHRAYVARRDALTTAIAEVAALEDALPGDTFAHGAQLNVENRLHRRLELLTDPFG